MPTLAENLAKWDRGSSWEHGGDEWSGAWGSAETQWTATLWPRVAPLLPANRLLEIAPGYGRWTQFLVGLCDEYIGVDIAERCIDRCRQRFADRPHARFEVNDGTSLVAVADHSIDLCFSFDSLVHVEADVIDGYLRELARTLSEDGIAFLHHSNLAGLRQDATQNPKEMLWTATQRLHRWVARHPALKSVLKRALPAGTRERIPAAGWRAESVSAAGVVRSAQRAGLHCIGQELINWDGLRLLDCVSLITRPGSRWDRPNIVERNPDFMGEARSAARRQKIFGSLPTVDAK